MGAQSSKKPFFLASSVLTWNVRTDDVFFIKEHCLTLGPYNVPTFSGLFRAVTRDVKPDECVLIFTARREASAVYAVVVCLSQVGVLLKRLNVASRKQTPHDNTCTLVF